MGRQDAINRARQIRAMTGLKKQTKINEIRFNKLMKDINADVTRATQNSKTLNQWITKMGGNATKNIFIEGPRTVEVQTILDGIVKGADYATLPRGGTLELVKGVISENTMHYVARMGDDLKIDLRKIALDGYNAQLTPREVAKQMSQKISGMTETRAKVIARTETMRASNLSNYTQAKLNLGAQSFVVLTDPNCCPHCREVYDNGNIVFDISDSHMLPPFHPNCRCVAVYSTKTPEEYLASLL
jgi:SPP1 gp7 family putative phage head morphogenesis protein